MKRRLIYTVLITAGLALAISRGWNELWWIWYDHQDWTWLWIVMNCSIGKVAWSEDLEGWAYVNGGTMIGVGVAIYLAQWLVTKLRRKDK